MRNLKDLEETIKNLAKTHIKRGTKYPLRQSEAMRTWRKQFSHLISKKEFLGIYNGYFNSFKYY